MTGKTINLFYILLWWHITIKGLKRASNLIYKSVVGEVWRGWRGPKLCTSLLYGLLSEYSMEQSMVYSYPNKDDNFHPVYREMICLPASAVPVGVSLPTTTTHTATATARAPPVPATSQTPTVPATSRTPTVPATARTPLVLASSNPLQLNPPAVLPTARSLTFPTTAATDAFSATAAVADFSTARAGLRKSATCQSFLEGGRRSNTGEAMPILIRPAVRSTTRPLSSKAGAQAFQVEPTTIVPMPHSGRL
jgi:hypothetical protein